MSRVKREPEEGFRATRQLSLYLTIPMLLFVSPLVGLFLGRLLDRWLHTDPILMIVFLALGFVAGGREVYRILARVTREEEQASRQRREAEEQKLRDAEEERRARDVLARAKEKSEELAAREPEEPGEPDGP